MKRASDSGGETEKNTRRERMQITLVFDPRQSVPAHVLTAIIDEWLVPCLVEEFSSEVRTRIKLAAPRPDGKRTGPFRRRSVEP